MMRKPLVPAVVRERGAAADAGKPGPDTARAHVENTAAAISAAALAASAQMPPPPAAMMEADVGVTRSDEAFQATLRRIQAEALRLLHERQPHGGARGAAPPPPPPAGLSGMGVPKAAPRTGQTGVRKQRPRRKTEGAAPPPSVVHAARYAASHDPVVRRATRVDPGAREVEALMRQYATRPTLPTRPSTAPPRATAAAPSPARAAERLRNERRLAAAELEAQTKRRAAAQALADRARTENLANARAARAAREKAAAEKVPAQPPKEEAPAPHPSPPRSFSGLPVSKAAAIRKRTPTIRQDQESAPAFDPLKSSGGWSTGSAGEKPRPTSAFAKPSDRIPISTKDDKENKRDESKPPRRPQLPDAARGKPKANAGKAEFNPPGPTANPTAAATSVDTRKDMEALLATLEQPTPIEGAAGDGHPNVANTIVRGVRRCDPVRHPAEARAKRLAQLLPRHPAQKPHRHARANLMVNSCNLSKTLWSSVAQTRCAPRSSRASMPSVSGD